MELEVANQLAILDYYIGSPLTDEQKEFVSNFGRDTISFSDPGTGKTHTVIAGLAYAQKYLKVQGREINCMSFTNQAVAEMAGRYKKICKNLQVSPTVEFNTFHHLSNQILKSAYPRMTLSDSKSVVNDVEALSKFMSDKGLDTTDQRYVYRVLYAINSLNSALIFHPEHVANTFTFVDLDIPLEIFQELRVQLFSRGKICNKINRGDIPLYCLYALMEDETIGAKWKGKYKIMVVDEFQDLSLLHLRILSYVADKLIVIGDMKQQIYAFNGACPQIVREYLKLRPNAAVCNLTQSFRCSQKIADFATKVILPNDGTIKAFTGHKGGDDIKIIERSQMNWKEIVGNIEADRSMHGNEHARDIMFLYRNNASAIPIIEELYKKDIPYRCTKFSPVMEVPMFESMCKLCTAAWQPHDYAVVERALELFPEFSKNKFFGTNPVISAMQMTGKDLFSVNYGWREGSSKEILLAMMAAKKAIEEHKSAGTVLMKVKPVYDKYIYRNEWHKMGNNDQEFYINLVAPICNSKEYPLMYNEELDKANKNNSYINAHIGVRCYTMHSAKGLEADDVYILDCNEGIFPNAKVVQRKMDSGCGYDAAVDIRSERNLLYVAATRAKENLIISYSTSQPSLLLIDPNSEKYGAFDEIYNEEDREYDDASAFFDLLKLKE